jgi:2-phospho-L-lactate guanylyltransferase (CobY/MobA/RfbA family)
MEYYFGPDSFKRHQEQAEALGARIEIRMISSLGLDLDLPEDLEILREAVELDPVIAIEERS